MTHMSILLLQLVIILATARACGLLLRYFGQPAVIGEMAAGLVLGPIVFGALFPASMRELFAKDSLPALSSLSTLGLVLFMFIVGAELRAPDGVRAQVKAAGCGRRARRAAADGAGHRRFRRGCIRRSRRQASAFWPFALFMAAAMSITAFPVMARILKDRGMTQTRLGRLALSSAAIADVFAWVMLAFVVALVGVGDGDVGLRARPRRHWWRLAAGRVRRAQAAVRVVDAPHAHRRRAVADVARGDVARRARLRGAHRMAGPARGVRRVPVRRLPAARRPPAALPRRAPGIPSRSCC